MREICDGRQVQWKKGGIKEICHVDERRWKAVRALYQDWEVWPSNLGRVLGWCWRTEASREKKVDIYSRDWEMSEREVIGSPVYEASHTNSTHFHGKRQSAAL